MNRRNRRRAGATAENGSPAPELDHLVVIRESARYDQVLMEGMVQQTLRKVRHLPGSEELQRAGMDVFAHPERWGATDRRVGDSRLLTIEREGVVYLYSMGTAAKSDLEDTNAFVSELVRIVETYRPVETWVVAFTRLMRSAKYVGDLYKAFTEHTKVLHCESEIKIATPEGQMLFQVLGLISATERDYIVRRHTAGRVAQWRRGAWIPNAYPPGYRLDNQRLVLDEASVERTRAMLRVLADLSLTPTECATRIGDLGVATPNIARRYGPAATIADARNPSEVVQTLVGWVDLYETGSYEVKWPNPFPGVTDVAGVAVEESVGYTYGVLPLVYELSRPEGGWGEDSVFEAIRERSTRPAATGGAAHTKVPPLSGLFQFADETHEYALVGDKPHSYKFLKRPLSESRRFSGWKNDTTDAQRVAAVSRGALHRSIADGVLLAVKEGLPAELDANRFQVVGPLPPLDSRAARLRALKRQLSEESSALERARRNARMAKSDSKAAGFVDDVRRHLAASRRLEGEIAALEGQIREPVLDETFETNGELVARAIAALANVEASERAGLRNALRTVISRERMWLDGPVLFWEIFVELPHKDGTVVLGPIRGEVGTLRRQRPKDPDQKRSANRRARAERLTAAGLGERAAHSAAACPHGGLESVLLGHLAGKSLLDDTDPSFARHVVATYTDPLFLWNRGHWQLEDSMRREVLRVLGHDGLTRADLIEAGLGANQIRYLSRKTKAPSGEPILRRVRSDDGAKYLPLGCPHCGGYATHSMVTPETRPGVLCPTCWRTPRSDSPVFPIWYRS